MQPEPHKANLSNPVHLGSDPTAGSRTSRKKAFDPSPFAHGSAIYKVRRVEIRPLVKMGSAVFLVCGFAIGVLAFLVFPHPSSASLSFSTRLLSAALFMALYAAVLLAAVCGIALLYNLLARRNGWAVTVHLARDLGEDA